MLRRLARATTVLLVLLAASILPAAHAQPLPLHLASATCPSAGVTLTTTSETSAVTAPGITTTGAQTIRVWGTAIITTGAATTTVELRIRRGSGTAGTSIGTPTAVTVTATNTVSVTFAAEDAPGEVAGQQYSLTVQQASATGNGTVAACELSVMSF